MHKSHHKAAHHHRKGEMEHHAEREKHKAAHHAKKGEHHEGAKHHSKMIDNRHVKDDHQEGIHRVIQRPGAMEVGQHGKMGMNHKHADTFKRSGGKLTPARG